MCAYLVHRAGPRRLSFGGSRHGAALSAGASAPRDMVTSFIVGDADVADLTAQTVEEGHDLFWRRSAEKQHDRGLQLAGDRHAHTP